MDIFCCQVLEYFNVNLCTSAFKSTCAVVFAVCSREYRDKYTRFCNFVFAYINVFCMVQVIFCLFFVVFAGSCLEYSFQSSLPCFFSFFFSNNSISVREFTVICNFTDQCVCDGSCPTLSAGTSIMISPILCEEVYLDPRLCSIFTPSALPKAILETAAAIP